MVRSQGASPLSFLIPEPNRNSECSQRLNSQEVNKSSKKIHKVDAKSEIYD